MFEQEFAALEAFGEFLADGLLDDSWACEADQSAGLCDVQIAEHGEACRDAAGGGVGQEADVGDGCFIELGEAGGDLGELHQAYNALHHARAAAGADDDEWMTGGEGAVDGSGDGFADDCAHAAANEGVLHCAEDYVVGAEFAECSEDGVVKAGLFLGGSETLFVGLDVGEVEWIGGAQAAVDEGVAGVEEELNALTGADLEVIAALGADVGVGLELGLEEDGAATGALDPEALGFDAGGLTVVGDWGKCGFRAEVGIGIAVGLDIRVCSFEPGHNDSL